MKTSTKRITVAAASVAAITVLTTVYALFDPASQWFPTCPVKALTGFDCPGCGSQRAFHAILNGDIAAAWHFNAGVFFAIPAAVFYIILDFRRERMPRLFRAANSPAAVTAVIMAVVLWTVVRNL